MATIIKQNEFEATVLKSTVPVLVDFFATWCGPCKMMAPVLDELSGEADGKFLIVKLDVDECSELAEQYNIHSVPTFVVFEGGNEKVRTSGVTSKAALKRLITE